MKHRKRQYTIEVYGNGEFKGFYSRTKLIAIPNLFKTKQHLIQAISMARARYPDCLLMVGEVALKTKALYPANFTK